MTTHTTSLAWTLELTPGTPPLDVRCRGCRHLLFRVLDERATIIETKCTSCRRICTVTIKPTATPRTP